MNRFGKQFKLVFPYFNRPATDNNRTQAFVPQGSISIGNPVGTAPAFIVELDEKMIASLPGVPGEMEFILQESIIPFIRTKYKIRSIINTCVLHCSGIGESMVDELIADLEKSDNPTVGLLAHPGIVDIRITASAEDKSSADQIIEPVRETIRNRLRENIFGEGSQSLSSVISVRMNELHCTIQILTPPFYEDLLQKLIPVDLLPLMRFSQIPTEKITKDFQGPFSSAAEIFNDPCLGIIQTDGDARSELALFWSWNSNHNQSTRYFAGPQDSVTTWSRNTILDFIRRNLG